MFLRPLTREHFIGDELKQHGTMASAHFTKFDPAEHPGNLYDAFCEFIDAFAYEYEALPGRTAPTGTTDVEAWTELDRRRQLLGRFASRNLQKDFEDEVAEADRSTITFKDTVKKLKDRYKPTQNKTYANYETDKKQIKNIKLHIVTDIKTPWA